MTWLATQTIELIYKGDLEIDSYWFLGWLVFEMIDYDQNVSIWIISNEEGIFPRLLLFRLRFPKIIIEMLIISISRGLMYRI